MRTLVFAAWSRGKKVGSWRADHCTSMAGVVHSAKSREGEEPHETSRETNIGSARLGSWFSFLDHDGLMPCRPLHAITIIRYSKVQCSDWTNVYDALTSSPCLFDGSNPSSALSSNTPNTKQDDVVYLERRSSYGGQAV